jgi:hypothetical protein
MRGDERYCEVVRLDRILYILLQIKKNKKEMNRGTAKTISTKVDRKPGSKVEQLFKIDFIFFLFLPAG